MNDLKAFIETELNYRRNLYGERPIDMLRDYNIEQEKIQSYNGRQFFEMLQNADDAAEGAGNSKVYVRLEGNELSISNSGEPFSVDGMQSILNSNLSPKKGKADKIGQKGLGFRSILSWADEVTIVSGGLVVRFSEQYARNFLDGLSASHPNVKTFLEGHKHISSYPIAVLTVPEILASTASDLPSNYTTEIKVLLKQDVLNDVRQQMDKVIGPNTLLFLNHIEEIEIETIGKHLSFTKTVTGNQVTVSAINLVDGSESQRTWTVLSRTGERDDREGRPKGWELKIAWSEDLSDVENVLYTYFRTEARFPFPALVHGTFELNDNRNQLVRDTEGHNAYLCSQLVDLMVEAAVKIAESNPEDPWLPLRLLNVDFKNIDSVLQDFGFEQILLEKIKKSRVFPTVNKSYITHEMEPVFYEEPVAELLSGEVVSDMMPVCIEERLVKFIQAIGCFYYPIADYIEVIVQHRGKLSFEDQARLIKHLLTYSNYKDETDEKVFHRTFLTDGKEQAVSPHQNIFILLEGDRPSYKLPEHLDVRFLHPDLAKELAGAFGVQMTDLEEKLSKINIRSYDFEAIAGILIAHYQKQETGKSTLQELHTNLFSLFQYEYLRLGKTPDDRPVNILKTPVLARLGKIRSAGEVYLGKHYAHDLSEKLYAFDVSKLLERPKLMGLEGAEAAMLKRYFTWLGVADFPRSIQRTLESNHLDYKPYLKYVLHNLNYPLLIQDKKFDDYIQIQNEIRKDPIINLLEYPDLDNILSNCDALTILHWTKSDSKLYEILKHDNEPKGDIKFNFKNMNYYHNKLLSGNNIKSYTRWKISLKEWMPVLDSAKKAAPDICCLSPAITSDFSPFVEKPGLTEEVLAERLKISPDEAVYCLTLTGVHRDINTFSTERLYRMLMRIPESEISNKSAVRIYRQILGIKQPRFDIKHPAYQDFITNGKILCSLDGVEVYRLVKESYYLETKSYSQNITRIFPIARLDLKKGAQKVERLFGVKRLANLKFEVEQTTPHDLQDAFREEMDRFKALAYTLVLDEDSLHKTVKDIKNARFHLVSEIKARYTQGEKVTPFVLSNFEFTMTERGNQRTFYLLAPQRVADLAELRKNHAFCESIADIFTILLDTEDVNRAFLNGLYYRNPEDREECLYSQIGEHGPEHLQQAASTLGVTLDIRLSFWQAFVKSTPLSARKPVLQKEEDVRRLLTVQMGMDTPKVEDFMRTDFFDDIGEYEWLAQMHDLFQRYSVDWKNFTRYFSGLDFTRYFQPVILDLKHEYKQVFEYALFQYLQTKAKDEQIRFFRLMDAYNQLSYDSAMGYFENPEKKFQEMILDKFQIALTSPPDGFSIDNILKENQIAFELQAEQSIPERLLTSKDVQALLLFGTFDPIKKAIDKEKSQQEQQHQVAQQLGLDNLAQTSDKQLYEAIVGRFADRQLTIRKFDARTVETISSTQKNAGGNGSSTFRAVHFNENSAQIGLIGESIAYDQLCKKHGAENVEWVSENANKAMGKHDGEAGKGYDIAVRKNGEVRFVEVKTVRDLTTGFKMTSTEMLTAQDYPEKYDILLIVNFASEEPDLYYYEAFFKLKKHESIFNNHRFKAITSSFDIKFITI